MPAPGQPGWVADLPKFDAEKVKPTRGWFSAGVSSGVDNFQGFGVGAALQGAGKLTGIDALETAGRDYSRGNQAEAQANGRPDLEAASWTDLDTLPEKVGYTVAQQLPTMAAYVLGAKAYARSGAGVPKIAETIGTAIPRALGGGGLRPGASIAARRAGVANGAREAGRDLGAMMTGGTIAGVPIGFGSMIQEADAQPGGLTMDDAKRALALSPVYAALDSIQPAGLLNLFKKGTAGNIVKRVFTAGIAGGVAELPQEGIQTALEQSFRPDLSMKEKLSNIVDGAVSGLVVGTVFGGLGGVRAMKRMDPASVTNDNLNEVINEQLRLPSPNSVSGAAAPNITMSVGEDGTATQAPTQYDVDTPTDGSQPLQAPVIGQPEAARPYKGWTPEGLTAGLGAAKKALAAGNASDEVKNFAIAASEELNSRNDPLSNVPVSTASVDAVQRELDGSSGGADNLVAPASASLSTPPAWEDERANTLKGISTRKWYKDASSPEELDAVLLARLQNGSTAQSDFELAKRRGIDVGNGTALETTSPTSPPTEAEPRPAEKNIATTIDELMGAATARAPTDTSDIDSTFAPQAPAAAAPNEAPAPAAPANLEGGDASTGVDFQTKWKADVQKAGQKDKGARSLKPADQADAQRQIYAALGRDEEIGDGLENLAKAYGILDSEKRLTERAVEIAQREPIKAPVARKAAQAQGFKGTSGAMFNRGAQAHLGGPQVTTFSSADESAAYAAGAAWAEEHNSVPRGALKKYNPKAFTGDITDEQLAVANGGEAAQPVPRVVPPAAARTGTVNKAIDATQASLGAQEDDVAAMKRMVREGDIDGAMLALNRVQNGERLFVQPETQRPDFRGERVDSTSRALRGTKEKAGALMAYDRDVTGVTNKVNRAAADRAIRKYELARAIDAALAEGAITGVERVKLVAKLRDGKIADVIAALPNNPLSLATPKVDAATRKTMGRSRAAFMAKLQRLWDEQQAEAAEAEAAVPELRVNRNGQLFDTIQSRPGVNAKRMAKMLGPQLYGDPTDMGNVTIKEILQNSYDAIKGLQLGGILGKGRIDIKVSNDGRTITVTDNGAGMTPALLGGKFLEIAGTGKETGQASGGFGIAKMLILYGNKDLRVTTARDGVVSTLSTSGEELFDSLEDPNRAPMIETREITMEDMVMFPEGHGVRIEVTIPETFNDPQSGKDKRIDQVRDGENIPALKYSPLFADIDVTFSRDRYGREREPEQLANIGSSFKAEDYTQFANVKFGWGAARVYVSRNQTPNVWGSNVHILSNGLWQFSQTMKKNPNDMWGDNLPYTLYVDISPTVRPEDAGYPFTFNRQAFTSQASNEWGKISQYINALYGYQSMSEDATSFGGLMYFKNDGTLTAPVDLKPEVPIANTAFSGIQAGDQVTVVEGKLLVNGAELPELTPEQLQQGVPSAKSLMIDPALIQSDRIAVHDNVTIAGVSYSDHMRAQFGQRWDAYMYLVGSSMKKIRDEVADALNYPELKQEAVGISIDKEYYGVSTRLPFAASFINPAATETADPELAPYAMLQTMIHEFAHHRERNHGVDFIKEMQRIQAVLKLNSKSDRGFNFVLFEDRFAEVFQKYADVYTYSNEVFRGSGLESSGSRFEDGDAEQVSPEGGRGAVDRATGLGEAGDAGQPLYDRIVDGAGPTSPGQGSRGDRQGAATFGPLSAVAHNASAFNVVSAISKLVPKASATAATRRMVMGWNTIGHMTTHHAKEFPEGALYAKAHLERRATQARWAQLFEAPYQSYEKLEGSTGKDEAKAAETIRYLMSLTQFRIDPTKTWDQHTHLQGAANEARLKELTEDANRKYNTVRGKGHAQVYNDFRSINEAAHLAMMSVSLHNLVATDPVLAREMEGFDVDPTDAFRERPALHESPTNAQRYWSDLLDAQVKRADEYIAKLRGATVGSTNEAKLQSLRLEPIEMRIKSIRSSIEAMREAPYFHLGRHGDHFVGFTLRLGADKKNVDQAAIEHAGKVIAAAGFTNVEISRDSTRPNVYIRVDTIEARQQLEQVALKLKADGWLKPDSEIKAAPRSSEGDVGTSDASPAFLDNYIQMLQANPMFEPTDQMTDDEKTMMSAKKAQMVSLARELWLDTLPDTAIAKVMVHRESVPGFDKDMIRNFAFRFQVGVNALSNLSSSAKLTDAFTQMRAAVFDAQVAGTPRHKDVDLLQSLVTEFLVREGQRPLRSGTNWIDTWRAVNHAFFLGFSPSYVLVNTTQLGVLLWPELSKKHGFAKSAKAIASSTTIAFNIMRETLKAGAAIGYKRALDAVITEQVLQNAAGVDEATASYLMKIIADGVIDIGGSSRELGRIADGSVAGKLDTGLRWAASFGLYSETFTRLVAALAARKLNGDDTAYAHKVIEQSMLNYADWNTARQMGKMGFAKDLTKVMTAFMQYSAQVTEKLYREFHAGIISKTSTAAEKKEARRFLGGHLAAVGTIAGTLGLPFATVVAAAAEKLVDLFDDDEQPYDATAAWRNFLADMLGPDIGDMAARGITRAGDQGFDLSQRAGEQNLLPFSQFLTDKRKWKEAASESALRSMGAPVSMVINILEGGTKIGDGDVIGGLVSMMPMALKGPAQSYRMTEKGYVDNQGNKLPMTPKASAYLMQLVGLTPQAKAQYSEERGDQAALKAVLMQRAKLLREGIARSIDEGDVEKRNELIARAKSFDAANPTYSVLDDISRTMDRRARLQALAAATRTPIGVNPKDQNARDLTSYSNIRFEAQ